MSLRIYEDLVVTRIDRVAMGANQHADILLYKRAGGKKVRKDGPAPETTGEILAERALQEKLDTILCAFRESVYTITNSDATNKAELLQKSITELLEAAQELPATLQKRASDAALDILKAKESEMKPSEVDLKAIPEAQRAAVEALQKSAGEAATRVTALEAEVAELKKKIPAATQEEIEKAALPESVRKRLEILEEKDEVATYVAKSRKEIGPAVAGMSHDDAGALLRRVAKGKTTEKDEAEILRLLKAHTELAKTSGLLKELGVDGEGDKGGSAHERATAIAKKYVADGQEKTLHKALERVWKEKPELYAEHLADRRKTA